MLLMWETLGIFVSAFALLLAICLICYERWILGKSSSESFNEG